MTGREAPDADLPALARLMPGATGARIAAIVRDARRKARRADRPMTEADLRAEIMPPDPRSPEDLRHIAIHEAGHAVVAHLLGYGVESVTIRGEGDAGGWTDVRMPSGSNRAVIEALGEDPAGRPGRKCAVRRASRYRRDLRLGRGDAAARSGEAELRARGRSGPLRARLSIWSCATGASPTRSVRSWRG